MFVGDYKVKVDSKCGLEKVKKLKEGSDTVGKEGRRINGL